MKNNNHILRKKGFSFAGSMALTDGVIKIDDWTDAAKESSPGIYCWVLLDQINNVEEVLYVGKYGKNLKKRFGEHINGFRGGSKSGIKKNNFLIKKLKATKTKIEVWHIKSHTFNKKYTSALGQEKLGSFSTEGHDEKDMIEYVTRFQQFVPKLNGTKGG